jgi:hypothetical protein
MQYPFMAELDHNILSFNSTASKRPDKGQRITGLRMMQRNQPVGQGVLTDNR